MEGLSRRPKQLPCKYFYDERGSLLFDQICDLPEYYLTRAELAIMQQHAGAMADALGADCQIIEYGSGSSLKTPLLLEKMAQPTAYVPIDISREHLFASAKALKRRLPDLQIAPLWADFTTRFKLPPVQGQVNRRVVYFPGSTIGNFGPTEAIVLLRSMARLVGSSGALLIGVDLWKAAAVVEPAYNDSAGVTAAFNTNLLIRINRELNANFDTDAFEHRAIFNDKESRIEMHLVSLHSQVVHIGESAIEFTRGESIRTECSYKYSLDRFAELACEAGCEVKQVWMDDKKQFSVQYLAATR